MNYSAKRFSIFGIIAVFLAVITLTFSACNDVFKGNKGTITLSFGGDARTVLEWPPTSAIFGSINHTITLTNDRETITRSLQGPGTVNVTVSVGLWNVSVVANYTYALT